MAALGMMNDAYFVGRTELLQWLSGDLGLAVNKIEECASGAVYCQILAAVHPKKVPVKKLNLSAKHEYEFIKNFKVLQESFNAAGITKVQTRIACKCSPS